MVVEEVALASETGEPPLILPVVEELVSDTPAAELVGVKIPAPDVPPVSALCPPSQDSLSEVIPAVGYACFPLSSVDNSMMPELVWVPALPQPKGRAADFVYCPVPVAVGPGGSVSRGELNEVYPFAAAWLCLQEYYVLCVGLR